MSLAPLEENIRRLPWVSEAYCGQHQEAAPSFRVSWGKHPETILGLKALSSRAASQRLPEAGLVDKKKIGGKSEGF